MRYSIKKQRLQYGLALLVLAVVTIFGAKTGESEEGNLTTQAATNRGYVAELVLDAVVEAVNRATMTAEVSGEIVAINFDVNDYVEKGQILMEIKGKKRKANLAIAKSSQKEAMAAYAHAEAEYERVAKLFKMRTVAIAKLEQSKAAYDAAKARLNAARAMVDSASETVANNIIRAPFSGYVLQRFVQLGETAQVGQPLFSGMSLAKLRLFANIPQQSIERVKKHNEARMILAEGEAVKLEKMTIFPYADEKSHSFGVRLSLPENSKGLYPGMIVKVAFAVGHKERLFIPVESVVRRSEVTGVYSVENGRINFRRVLVGRMLDDNMIEVLSGLAEGEQVAIEPVKAGQVRLQSLAKKITL